MASLSILVECWLERLASEEHSILLRAFLNYGCKKFYNIWPRRIGYKTCLFIIDGGAK
jgi:hypothetical protein